MRGVAKIKFSRKLAWGGFWDPFWEHFGSLGVDLGSIWGTFCGRFGGCDGFGTEVRLP